MEKRLDDMTQVGGDTSTSKELCLLSLDGGGIKGLSSLLILRRLMENINPANPPKPYEHFDMICGTSTGGLIAIMLGRLRLSVQECIDEYLKLSPLIFVKTKHRLKFDASVQGRFDHEAFERGIRNMLVKYGFSEDALFREEQAAPPCKVYAHRGVVILSNYYSDRRDSELWSTAKIWEVARATSAAPTFFDPITISGEKLGDGALGANNPVRELEEEARDVWGRRDPAWNFEANVRCLVSVGTGKLALEPFHETFWSLKILKSLQGLLTETEDTANHFHKVHTDLFQKNQAFRFNVDQGLEEVGLEEINKIDNVKALTRKYLSKETVFIALGDCVQQLKNRGWIHKIMSLARSHSLRVSSQLELTPIAFDLFSSCSHTSEYDSWSRDSTVLIYDKIKSSLKAEHNEKSASYIAAGLIDNGDSRSDRVPKVYYVNCHPQTRAGHNLESGSNSSALAPTSIGEILCSLTLQALNERREAFLARYMDSIKGGRSLQELLDSRDPLDHETMKRHFVSHIRALPTPTIITIDNMDDAANDCGARLVRELARECQDMNESIKFIVSAFHPRKLSFGVPVASVWNTLEYSECLGILRGRIQENRRREDICDAEPGTVDWIWHHDSYTSWKSMKAGVLWVEGKPGSGKSVLAKSVSSRHKKILEAERDRRRRQGEGHSVSEDSLMLFSDWYYSTRGNVIAQNHEFLFQALLFQWLEQNPALFPFFASEYRQHEPLSELWINLHSSGRIVKKIVEQGIPILSIVDAMDESENRQDSDIKREKVLWSFLEMVAEVPQSKAKFIVLSRPTKEIENHFLRRSWQGYLCTISMQENNFEVISRIVSTGMSSLRQQMEEFSREEPFDSDAYPEGTHEHSSFQNFLTGADYEKYEKIQSYLLDNADGVILWVTLIIETLRASIENGEDSFTKLEKKLHSLPRDLSTLYQQIVDDLCSKLSQDTIEQARRTLMWASGSACGPLPLGALYEAIRISPWSPTRTQDGPDAIFADVMQFGDWNAFRSRLRLWCGPLLDVIISDKSRNSQRQSREILHPNDTVQLIHRTVKDFLAHPNTPHEFRFTSDDASLAVNADTKKYFSILRDNIFKHFTPTSNRIMSPEKRGQAIDDMLNLLERRMLLSFLFEALSQDDPEILMQCAKYIYFGLLPLYTGPKAIIAFVRRISNPIRENFSLPQRIDLSRSKDISSFFGTVIREMYFPFGASQHYSVISSDSSLTDGNLRDLLFAELTHQACIKGLPNAAFILVNLWFPKNDRLNDLSRNRIRKSSKLSAVAFLVSLEHGPTDICRELLCSNLRDVCFDCVCEIWHHFCRERPGLPLRISLAEELAVQAGHVEIIQDLVFKSRFYVNHRPHLFASGTISHLGLTIAAVFFILSTPILVLSGFLELRGFRASQSSQGQGGKENLEPERESYISKVLAEVLQYVVNRPVPDVFRLPYRSETELNDLVAALKSKAPEACERAQHRDGMVPNPKVLEALSVVMKHDEVIADIWRKSQAPNPLGTYNFDPPTHSLTPTTESFASYSPTIPPLNSPG